VKIKQEKGRKGSPVRLWTMMQRDSDDR
jgi:hypothetical protein